MACPFPCRSLVSRVSFAASNYVKLRLTCGCNTAKLMNGTEQSNSYTAFLRIEAVATDPRDHDRVGARRTDCQGKDCKSNPGIAMRRQE